MAIRQAIFMTSYTNKIKAQRGIGVIEVLIAAVVVAVGLLSLASLQGTIMHSSGESKARSEAVKLAEEKLEEFRNNINKSDFDVDLAIGAGDDSINGSNATFARSWTLTDAAGPDRKNISVTVTWGGASADETVNMVSQVIWADPGKATDYATDGNGLSARAPSPNNNSSSTPGEQFDLDEIDGETSLDDGSGLYKYTDDEGRIYLLDSTGKAVIKFNGGSIHTIKGNVYAGIVGNGQNPSIELQPLTSYPVTFSDLAYCVFPVHEGQSDYICYFGGDCTHDGTGCLAQEDSVTFTAVSGGWYGKVGLIETSEANLHNKKVCFAEDIAGNGIETATTTARLYLSQRLDANNNVVGSEGINQSFACQDFLVVEATGHSNDCNHFRNFAGLSVPSSTVYRDPPLGPNDNNVSLAENVSSCGSIVTYTIAGGISGDQANLVQVFVNGNGCTITSNNNIHTYQCTITVVDTTASVTITATGGNVTPVSTTLAVSTDQTSMAGPSLQAGTSTPVSYTVTGHIGGNQANSVTLTMSNDGSCTNNNDGSYTCTITSTPGAVTINATGGDVSPASANVTLGVEPDVAGPEFIAATPAYMNYVITGAVTGNNANSVNFSLNGGSCTNNNDNTYTCTIYALPGDVIINATGANVQQASGAATLAGVAAVTGPAFTTSAASCAVTVSGIIEKGTGNTFKVDDVTVTSTPSATNTCEITKASGSTTYSCDAGTVTDGASVTIGGTHVSAGVGNPVTVDCTANSISITTGPKLTTTN
ncbi:hypothetical protein [Methylobacter luteus]|uniref:hypothetical protein n=1 Tax=Methylobacter luteus TaxID=415 RepID=UPI0012DDBC83|nr:hypothetical protein [Methylobacter luteus]